MATPPPDDFKCPISLEIMSDPVILSSGHTFDRPSIQRWLDSGNRTCPITQIPLPQNPSLIPNHALRSLISNFTLLNSPKSHPYPEEPQTLIHTLSSPSTPSLTKLNCLNQLNRLTKRDPVFRRKSTENGAVSVILRDVVHDPQLQESALSVIFNLSLDDDNKVGMVAEGVIGFVVSALRYAPTHSCRALAATTLTSLAMVEVNKGTIGAYPFAIKALVGLLRDGKGRGRREAATALYALCSFPDNKIRAIECGSVPILIELADLGIDRAGEVLGLLGKCRQGRDEMGRVDGFVRVLMRVLRSKSSRSVEHALGTLNSVCCYSDEMASGAAREGVMEICLGLVGDENGKIRKNAASLIQILRRWR